MYENRVPKQNHLPSCDTNNKNVLICKTKHVNEKVCISSNDMKVVGVLTD